uniref:Uncharacterized protein n=1 Tax=Acrobeloides nanus TaxID=290746 RepID=A0A914EL62_9BILA
MEPEATKRIESIHKALAKLEATFHGRDLSFLRNREVSRRLACTKPTCKCNDENVIVGTMTSLLQENEKFLPLITEGAPVDEPWS